MTLFIQGDAALNDLNGKIAPPWNLYKIVVFSFFSLSLSLASEIVFWCDC
jgi:hypothetical protein